MGGTWRARPPRCWGNKTASGCCWELGEVRHSKVAGVEGAGQKGRGGWPEGEGEGAMGDGYSDEEFEEYEDDFEEEEEEAYEDDFEEEAEPAPARPRNPEEELAAAIRAENDQARAVQAGRDAGPSVAAPEIERYVAQPLSEALLSLSGAGGEADAGVGAGAGAGASAQAPRTEAEMQVLQARAERWRRSPLPLQETAIDGMLALQPKTLQQLSQMGRGSYRNLVNKSSQTREDDEDCEVQTERPAEARAAAAQAPEDLGTSRERVEARGRPRGRGRGLSGAGGRAGGAGRGGGRGLDIASLQRLGRFVTSAGAVMERLLAERQRASKSLEAAFSASAIVDPTAPVEATSGAPSLSAAGVVRLLPPPDLVDGRRVTALIFSPVTAAPRGQPACPLLLTVYAPAAGGARAARERVAGRGRCGAGVLLVWDLAHPQSPAQVLTCEGSPVSCCWGPGDTVVAGLEDGGICVWDLADPATASAKPLGGEGGSEAGLGDQAFQRPAYTTEFRADTADVGTIVAVAIAPENSTPEEALPGRAKGSMRGRKQVRLEEITRQGGAGFQCLSLDAWGTVRQWNVVEASPVDVSDMGLRVGGRKRVIESSVIRVAALSPKPFAALTNWGPADNCGSREYSSAPSPKLPLSAQARRLLCMPGNAEEFIIGTDDGRCLRGSRFGKRPSCPRRYVREEDPGLPSGAAVTGMHFCPAAPGIFAAGYEDGAVTIFRTRSMLPLRTWEGFATGGILEVKWSPSQPHIVLALDEASCIHFLDVHEDRPLRTTARCRLENLSPPEGGLVELLQVTEAAVAKEAQRGGVPEPPPAPAHCLALADSSGAVRCYLLRSPPAAPVAELAALRALA